VCSKLFCVVSTRGTNPDEAIYKSSQVSQGPRVRRGRGADASSRSALALMGTLIIKKEVKKPFPFRPVTYAVRPSGWLGSARHAHRLPRHTHAHGPAGGGGGARVWHGFVPFSTSQ
jgi:hypothetical protein